MAFGAGVGYVLGGASTYQTSPETESLEREIVLLGGLMKFDMTSKDLSNSTVKGTRSTGKIQMGGMRYIPSFGPKGLFILWVGTSRPALMMTCSTSTPSPYWTLTLVNGMIKLPQETLHSQGKSSALLA